MIRLCISNALNYFGRDSKRCERKKSELRALFILAWINVIFYSTHTNKHILHLWFFVEHNPAKKNRNMQ